MLPTQDEIVAWTKKGQSLIWHPFTQMKEWEEEKPTIIVSGKGATLCDIEGNHYLDATSSIWVNIHGHQHKTINQAMKKQLDHIAHSTLLGLTNIPAIELAEQLIQIAPKGEAGLEESENREELTKVFYSDNGSTAVEIALKIAFSYWQHLGGKHKLKKKFVSFSNAYHGDTIGSVSLGGIDLFHAAYGPLLFDTVKIPSPTCYRCPIGLEHPSCKLACVDEAEKVLKKHQKQLAGLIIEPLIQAAAGMLCAPPGYLGQIRALCTKYEILMIVDEVATGFGRTGKMFASEHEEVVPDLMAISKGLTGGYLPLAATLTRQKIYDAFLGDYAEFKTFFHGHSYTGNPLGCVAALANLEVFKQEKTLEKLEEKINYVKKTLKPWRVWKHIGDIRQVGLMIAIELVANKKTKLSYPLEIRVGGEVCKEAKSRGVLLRPLGNVIAIVPPLSTTMDELEKILRVVGDSIKKVTAKTFFSKEKT